MDRNDVMSALGRAYQRCPKEDRENLYLAIKDITKTYEHLSDIQTELHLLTTKLLMNLRGTPC